jgi:type II secretion system (T2SS) protein M
MSSNFGLSQRDRRTLIFGVATISTLVGVSRGLPALMTWEEDQIAQAQTVAEQLAAVRAGTILIPAIRDSLKARRARLVLLDSTLLSGTSPSSVAAELSSTLEDLADDNHVRVTAVQLHADSVANAGLARVEVRVTGIADVTGLAGFLHAIEGGDAPLVVKELSVSQQDPVGDNKPEALRIDVLVAGIGLVTDAKASQP